MTASNSARRYALVPKFFSSSNSPILNILQILELVDTRIHIILSELADTLRQNWHRSSKMDKKNAISTIPNKIIIWRELKHS